MLVLKRNNGEGVSIGDNIKVTVIKEPGGAVKLAIEAPKDIVILRTEVEDNREIIQRIKK